MRSALLAVICALAGASGASAQSSVYATDLGKCFVEKTSEQDKIDLVRWTYAAMSAHPAVATLAKVSPADRELSNRTMAALVNRLLTTDCRAAAIAALKYEGSGSLKPSFGLLGQVAIGSIFEHPAVNAAMTGFVDQFDESTLNALIVEAGRTPRPSPKPQD